MLICIFAPRSLLMVMCGSNCPVHEFSIVQQRQFNSCAIDGCSRFVLSDFPRTRLRSRSLDFEAAKKGRRCPVSPADTFQCPPYTIANAL
ncbi:hypothetical protein D918_04796 [Trichuris suis]|nr:hypothetical protein D918_04796 [Trichuris suis]